MEKDIIIKDGKEYLAAKNGGLLRHVKKNDVIAGVYCITDLSNGKKYIGSSKDLHKRMRCYRCSSKASGVLRDIVDINNISSTILEVVNDIDELLSVELYYIKELDTIYPNGYNKKDPTNNKFFHKDCYVKRSSNIEVHNKLNQVSTKGIADGLDKFKWNTRFKNLTAKR